LAAGADVPIGRRASVVGDHCVLSGGVTTGAGAGGAIGEAVDIAWGERTVLGIDEEGAGGVGGAGCAVGFVAGVGSTGVAGRAAAALSNSAPSSVVRSGPASIACTTRGGGLEPVDGSPNSAARRASMAAGVRLGTRAGLGMSGASRPSPRATRRPRGHDPLATGWRVTLRLSSETGAT
jgi:hypothetical protein